MEVLAKAKFIRLSTKKARPIADVVRGRNAVDAATILKAMPSRASKELLLVVNSAIANAENNFNLDPKALTISKITVDGGPALKRMRFTGRSRISPLRKPTAHITVVVSGDVKTKKAATEKTAEKKNVETVETPEEHKLEVERPESRENLNVAASVKAKNKFFRRKTG